MISLKTLSRLSDIQLQDLEGGMEEGNLGLGDGAEIEAVDWSLILCSINE